MPNYGYQPLTKCNTLAHYQVAYQPDKRHFRDIAAPRLFETPHRSPQLPLWELGDAEWLKVVHLPDYAPRKRPALAQRQAALFSLDGTA